MSKHSPENPKIWLSCGELSGDQRAAEFWRARPAALAQAQGFGIAGPHLRAAGVSDELAMESLQTMGFAEVLKRLPQLLGTLEQACRLCERQHPALAILVDYGEFHMRLGKRLRALGIKVFHLAPPKLWAWGAWRVKRLCQSADAVGVLFPFEQKFYEAHGLNAIHVGHPAVEIQRDSSAAADKLLLLPGSRPGEIAAHHDLLLAGSLEPARQSGLKRVYCLAQGQSLPTGAKLPTDVELRVIAGPNDYRDGALAAAASGTVNIELAALGIPHVVVYRTSPASFALAKRLIQTDWANPVNIAAGHALVEEFMQDTATPHNLAGALGRAWRQRQRLSQNLTAFAATLKNSAGLQNAWQHCLSWPELQRAA